MSGLTMYADFLDAFATAQAIRGGRAALLAEHAARYDFQIRSRERAATAIAAMAARLGPVRPGLRVLDIGCAYGSFAIEFARLGAVVTGIDVSRKWLGLARIHAEGEAAVTLIEADAAHPGTRATVAGPFDWIVLNDVLEHVWDTAGLVANIAAWLAPGGAVICKVPNGMACSTVLSEGHKRLFGVATLPPDAWGAFTRAPFSIYYRRLAHYRALFADAGLRFDLTNSVLDPDHVATLRHIAVGRRRVQEALATTSLRDNPRFDLIAAGVAAWDAECAADVDQLPWEPLWFKYRCTFWEAIATPTPQGATTTGPACGFPSPGA